MAAGFARSRMTAVFGVFLAVWCLATSWGLAGENAAAPVVSRIDVRGCVTLTPEQVKYKMGTREGQPLDRQILDEDFQRLFKMGIFDDVQIKEEALPDGVRLIVLLREKDLIRRISYRGNTQIREKRLAELIKTKVGDRFGPGQVNLDARAIEDWYHQEFYYFAKVEPKAEPFEDGVRLIFDIEEGGRMAVRKIVFRGNQNVTNKEMLKFMETKQGSFLSRGRYDRRTFEKDLERLRMLFQSKGFLDVQVTEQPFEITANVPKSRWQRREAYIHIDIDEGPRYKVGRVEFAGNELVDTETLRSVVGTMPGEYFSPVTAQKDADTIRDVYGRFPSSRYFTRVRPERVLTEDEAVVDVVFNIQEGEEVSVEDVQILGLTKTQDRVVRREVAILPGEKIDSDKINETKRRLKNLGYFKDETLAVDVKEGSASDRSKVVVDLEEVSTGRLQLGAGVSTRESFIGSIQLKQHNFDLADKPESWKEFFTGKAFTGAGQDFRINLSKGSKTSEYGFDFLNPWIFDKPISFGLGASYSTNEWDEFDEERLGGYLSLGRKLWLDDLKGTITYKGERVNMDNFDDNVSNEIKADGGETWITRAILNVTYDSRDSRFDPTKGMLLSATQEIASDWLGGERNFWRSFLEGQYFHPIFKDKQNRPWVLALRGEIGACESYGGDERVPVYERMYAGGIGSIRGFGYNQLSPRDENGDEIGGKLRSTGTVEFFMPVWEEVVRMSVFYDAGAVWADLDGADDDAFRSSAGVGVHLKTPLGPMPVRIYYSQALNKVDGDDEKTIQFTFGALF